MKKSSLLFLFFAGIVIISSCKKDEETAGTGSSQIVIDAKQRSLLMDFTATWCGPCGAHQPPTPLNL